MSPRTVAIVTADRALQALTERLPKGLRAVLIAPADYPSPETLVARLGAFAADLTVLGPDLDDRLILGTGAALRRSRPETSCVAYRPYDARFFTEAIRTGLRDVIDPESDGLDALMRVLAALGEESELRRERLLSGESGRSHGGSITVMFGPKGGIGRTTVAVNLAVSLARVAPQQVVLVDLDLVAGGVADMLRLEPGQSIAAASAKETRQDPALLKLTLSTHPSGLFVLPAPISLVEAESVDPEDIGDTLQMLGKLFEFVIVDTGPGSTDVSVAAVRVASDLVVVATPEITGLRTLERHLAAIDATAVHQGPRHLVLNRADDRSGVATVDVEDSLGMHVSFAVPTDRQFVLAANQGVPYVDAATRGPNAGLFDGLAKQLAGGESGGEAVENKKWFW